MRAVLPRLSTALVVPAAVVTLAGLAVAPVDAATPAPVVTQLSRTSVPFWGGNQLAVFGRNFTNVQRVMFGGSSAYGFQVVSPTKIVATYPEHARGRVAVQVVTDHGTSRITHPGLLTYRDPNVADPINGGWSVQQEQAISARFMATASRRMAVPLAPKPATWTPSQGRTAVNRARAWLGMPYSFAGGNSRTPTKGVCSTSQGTAGALDCHVVGFDCSGLVMYAWGPYIGLPHFAATQFRVGGAHHPSPAQLMPGDLLFFGSTAANIHHVAIYEGGGRVIQAPQSGRPVSETTLANMLGWDYFGATRPRTIGPRGAVPVASRALNAVGGSGGWTTIAGRNFTNITSVTVGGRLSYPYRVTASGLAVQMPAHAPGTVNVAISNAAGTSASVPVTYVGRPALTAAAPASGPRTGGTAVTISGANFNGVYKVTFGSVPATSLVVRSVRTMTLVTPAHTAGRLGVTIYSRYGNTYVNNVFTYLVPAAR